MPLKASTCSARISPRNRHFPSCHGKSHGGKIFSMCLQPFLVVLLILFSFASSFCCWRTIKHEVSLFLLKKKAEEFCFVVFRPPRSGDCFVVVLFFRFFLLLFCCAPFLHLRSDTTKKKDCELKKIFVSLLSPSCNKQWYTDGRLVDSARATFDSVAKISSSPEKKRLQRKIE